MIEDSNDRLEVHLGDRSYPIEIRTDLDEFLYNKTSEFLRKGIKSVAIVDQGLLAANPNFLRRFFNSIEFLELPSGENTKSTDALIQVWDFLASHNLDRTSSLFAVGGGVIGDLGGFAAASYLRGISLYQIPTTLLSMVDSSVGGKTGINLVSGKNLVGAFHQPKGVFTDLKVLSTLPDREFSAGMAEVIKYGMIGNRILYDRILKLRTPLSANSPELLELILMCCSEKASVVQADEKENADGLGGRALLNLGHTFAHAIEAIAGYGQYLHGEAVSIGLVCALRLSKSIGLCSDDPDSELINLLKSYHLPVELSKTLPLPDLMEKMKSDKKVHRGKLRFVVMNEIGSAFVKELEDLQEVEKVWRSVGAK